MKQKLNSYNNAASGMFTEQSPTPPVDTAAQLDPEVEKMIEEMNVNLNQHIPQNPQPVYGVDSDDVRRIVAFLSQKHREEVKQLPRIKTTGGKFLVYRDDVLKLLQARKA